MKLSLLAATAAALVVAALPATASAHPRVKEYPLSEFAVPADIAPGPDGALYAPDGSLSRLWRVTTKGKVSSIELGVGPAGVATGRDGALWVTDRSTDEIHRVTTENQVTSYKLPTAGAFPTDIVSGPDGALWFTESRGDKIGRITTAGEITEYPLPTSGAFATDITVGPDGAIWFTEAGGNKVGRITTAGELTEYPLETPDSLPGPIVTGRDGYLYFAERNTNVISRMTTSGKVTKRFPLRSADANPIGLAATRHGLWISQHSAGSLAPMTYWGWIPGELRTRSAPDAITIGPDGNLWYASGNESKIGRVDIGF